MEQERSGVDYDQPVWMVPSTYGHTFMDTGSCADEAQRNPYVECLTCGAKHALINDGDGRGHYENGAGESPQSCSGRTDLVHGYERVCQHDSGRSCAVAEESGECEHTSHECDCLLCA